MKLDELLYLYTRSKTLQPATVKSYEGIIRRVVVVCGDRAIEKFDEAAFDELRQASLLKVKAVTWNNLRRHLMAILEFAVKRNLLQQNYLRNIATERVPRNAPKNIDPLYVREIARYVYDGAGYREPCGRCRRINHAWFWITFVHLLYYTGIRLRQALELEWRDLKFATGRLELREESNKTKYHATVPIRPELLELLKVLYEKSYAVSQINASPGSRMFQIRLFNHSEQSNLKQLQLRSMNQSHVKKFFQGYSALTGVKISPHRIRHTTATVLAKKSNNPKAVMHQMGHRNYSTFLTYVHPDIDDLLALQTHL